MHRPYRHIIRLTVWTPAHRPTSRHANTQRPIEVNTDCLPLHWPTANHCGSSWM